MVATEFSARLAESKSTHGVIETGYSHTRLEKGSILNCTLIGAPHILLLKVTVGHCFSARRKRQSMWSPNSGWSRPWTGSATGSWRTTFIRCLEDHVINLVGIVFLPFQERKDSTRFAKGQSETFSTLEGLVAKGVKVSSKFAMIGWNWKLIQQDI